MKQIMRFLCLILLFSSATQFAMENKSYDQLLKDYKDSTSNLIEGFNKEENTVYLNYAITNHDTLKTAIIDKVNNDIERIKNQEPTEYGLDYLLSILDHVTQEDTRFRQARGLDTSTSSPTQNSALDTPNNLPQAQSWLKPIPTVVACGIVIAGAYALYRWWYAEDKTEEEEQQEIVA